MKLQGHCSITGYFSGFILMPGAGCLPFQGLPEIHLQTSLKALLIFKVIDWS
jgi:hypothetical protein